ncbi:hypothetical protein COV11_04160 [Candidatus Woesearchaeota archaeon CG10_big_fil_rev_8_21_14_0_10_30_7]|nr:MAG: hypothetical protein COV11_04160 [Candidatus Woesearchaeota archaeon CG10_big_fil_rev_8_21_14_0_10_30_7]
MEFDIKNTVVILLSFLVLLSACTYVLPTPQPRSQVFQPVDDVSIILGAKDNSTFKTSYGDLVVQLAKGSQLASFSVRLYFDGSTFNYQSVPSLITSAGKGNHTVLVGDFRFSQPTPPGIIGASPDVADIFIIPRSRALSNYVNHYFTDLEEGKVLQTKFGSLEVVAISNTDQKTLLKLDGHSLPKLKRGDMFRDVEKRVDLYVTGLHEDKIQQSKIQRVDILFVE